MLYYPGTSDRNFGQIFLPVWRSKRDGSNYIFTYLHSVRSLLLCFLLESIVTLFPGKSPPIFAPVFALVFVGTMNPGPRPIQSHGQLSKENICNVCYVMSVEPKTNPVIQNPYIGRSISSSGLALQVLGIVGRILEMKIQSVRFCILFYNRPHF
jgi:hypothetical protein